ncbi:MAG: TauD/TfdA family dioxygenase [Ectothiorhodospiraceae bacterium]|nr:TauD/TfdA family dioxygenase [Ectothiorhodospiraceae bacterium]
MAATSLLTHSIDDPAAWRATDFPDVDALFHVLTAAEIADLDRAVERALATPRALESLTAADLPLPTLGVHLVAMRDELEGGRGFAMLRGLPVERWSEAESRVACWAIGQHLGIPEPQDGKGSLMHDVRDTGERFESSETLREYQTNRHINFHNDGADAFVLMVLAGAREGGESLLVSAVTVFNTLLAQRPDLARVLQEAFHADTRGQRRDGARVQSMPIYHFHGGRLTANYKSNLIHAAQRFADVPRLSEAQREALEMLDRLCADPDLCLQFTLRPGDVEIGNNYVTFHARRGYQDPPDAPRRHLLRLWLTLPNGRPLPPTFRGSREFGATWARRHGD